MTDEQVRDVRDLTRAAGIKPTTTRISRHGHPILAELAPGERTLPGGLVEERPARRALRAPAAAAATAVAAVEPARGVAPARSPRTAPGGGKPAKRSGGGGGNVVAPVAAGAARHSAASFSGRR